MIILKSGRWRNFNSAVGRDWAFQVHFLDANVIIFYDEEQVVVFMLAINFNVLFFVIIL